MINVLCRLSQTLQTYNQTEAARTETDRDTAFRPNKNTFKDPTHQFWYSMNSFSTTSPSFYFWGKPKSDFPPWQTI